MGARGAGGAGSAEGEAERFDPVRDGPDLAYEHVHRYVLASSAVEGLRVLDLAAGTGYGSAILRESAARLVSLDLSRMALAETSLAVCADALALPFADGEFDAVVCFEAIEHVSEPHRLIAEARRVLRDPALFLVSTPDRVIYSDRAGHRNPHHVAEMSRREFERALRADFGHVRMLGQGLWAGSWIAGLPRGRAAQGLGRRSVEVLPRPLGGVARSSDGEREARHGLREQIARWADPSQSEVPTPVYLVAACADSDSGWQRVQRSLPRESLLHDPRQWLLGQYDRLTRAWSGELASFRAELERARRGHRDQADQIARARDTITGLETELTTARRQAERQLAEIDAKQAAWATERSGGVELRGRIEALQSEMAKQEARRAQAEAEFASTTKRNGEELDRARKTIATLEAELSRARSAAVGFETQIADAHVSVGALERELDGAREGAADLAAQIAAREAELDRARAAATLQSEELAVARRAADGQARELASARQAIDQLQREIVLARSSIDAKTAEIDAARETIDAKAAEIDAARGVIDEKDRELDRARRVIDAKEGELEEARVAIAEKEAEIDRARTGIADKVAEIDAARVTIDAQAGEIDRARAASEEYERALAEARGAAQDAERAVDRLEGEIVRQQSEIRMTREAMQAGQEAVAAAQSRPLARIGLALADWVDRGRAYWQQWRERGR